MMEYIVTKVDLDYLANTQKIVAVNEDGSHLTILMGTATDPADVGDEIRIELSTE